MLVIGLDMSQNVNSNTWLLYIDGASRNNPGVAGAGIYLVKNSEPVLKKGIFLGIKTNNQAEYLSLLMGLLFAGKYIGPTDKLLIRSDSELLVRQVKGIYAVKNSNLRSLYCFAQELLSKFNYNIEHVLRANNKEADALANLAIDKKLPIPLEFLPIWRAYEECI